MVPGSYERKKIPNKSNNDIVFGHYAGFDLGIGTSLLPPTWLAGSYEGKGKPKNVIFGHYSGFKVSVQIQNELFNYLSSKLIAGESGNSQPLSFIASVQSLKLIVVGVGQTSVGCHIQDDHDLASEM